MNHKEVQTEDDANGEALTSRNRRNRRCLKSPIPVKQEPERIKDFLKAKDGNYLPTLIMLGYAAKDALVPTQVKATVENKVRWNKW